MLKYSRYNHVVKIPEEEAHALYNLRTGALLRLDPVRKAVFDNALDMPGDSRAIQSLQQAGFLVAYDELRHMRTQAFSACGTGRFLGLPSVRPSPAILIVLIALNRPGAGT